MGERINMDVINIEDIRESNRLKKEKCREAKDAMRDMLSDEQAERFDIIFDDVMDRIFKGVLLKEKGEN